MAVLVAGGGPVGLSAFIALARAGVPALLVERHTGTAIHPKARGLNARTMEIFRQWELEGEVSAAGLSTEDHGYFFRGATLVGPDYQRTGGGGLAADVHILSPSTWMVISQDALEPVLLQRARALRPDGLRFGHELVSLEREAGSILATIVERATGETRSIRSRYLVGADGAASMVREWLGVPLVGQGPLVHNVSILFEADLREAIADRRSAVYYLAPSGDVRPRGYPMSVGNPPPDGVLLTVNGSDRWLLVVGAPGTEPAASTDFDRARNIELVRRAVGQSDLAVEPLSVMAWTPAARVASSYAVDGVFLAGDAAHEMTPSGAFGLNTGIADAHGLAWKLAAVVNGWAGPGLLDTYDAERRPVGAFTADQSYQLFAGTRPPRPFGNWGVIFGATYASAAVIADGTPAPVLADPVVDYVPVARPGHRAPHAWLTTPDGRRGSTLDCFGSAFALLTASPAWVAQAATAVSELEVPLKATLLGVDATPVDAAAFEQQYAIGEAGAVLVRPDGHVAWRTAGGPQRGRELATAVEAILDRKTANPTGGRPA